MKIISNRRYKKLIALERWEDVRIQRGISSSMPKTNIIDSIKWLLAFNIPEFLDCEDYKDQAGCKLKPGEIGRLFGKAIIVNLNEKNRKV